MRRLVPLTAGAVLAAAPLAGAHDHEEPKLYGGRIGPFASPPGWFGPGPAGHRYPGAGPGAGWGYPGLGGGGAFVGYPVGAYRYPLGGSFWGIPGAAGSFWTNGLSLYGPPVPTYGPVPGAFGGSDQGKLFFRNPPPANGVFVGLGWGGYRTPSPRPVPPTVSVWPAPGGIALPPASDPGCFRVAVRLPDADATVFVDKQVTKQTGAERVYESPPVAEGSRYKYEIIAQWTENGRTRAESRTVSGSRGETLVVDFTRPADETPVASEAVPSLLRAPVVQ